MQNLIVNSTARGLSQVLPGGISKGFTLISQPKCCISNDSKKQPFTSGHNRTMLLPGGGLRKLQGSFKEEHYFNANDHRLLAHIQQSGFRLKCEKSASNWAEFERMANACPNTPIRKSNEISKCKLYTEESFFLQEQKSLLDRILEVLKRLAQNRRSDPPLSHGGPFGGFYPYGPHYQSHPAAKEQTATPKDEDKGEEEEDAKKTDDTVGAASEKSETDESAEGISSHHSHDEPNQVNDSDNETGYGDKNGNGRGNGNGNGDNER